MSGLSIYNSIEQPKLNSSAIIIKIRVEQRRYIEENISDTSNRIPRKYELAVFIKKLGGNNCG